MLILIDNSKQRVQRANILNKGCTKPLFKTLVSKLRMEILHNKIEGESQSDKFISDIY